MSSRAGSTDRAAPVGAPVAGPDRHVGDAPAASVRPPTIPPPAEPPRAGPRSAGPPVLPWAPIIPPPAEPLRAGTPAVRPPIDARGIRPTSSAAAQLDLALVPALPRLAIEPDWKDQARLWGHAFHPMCSYLASFPAALAHAFIARYTRPGDVVIDPFSGRGTTPLQACVEGRIGAGNDLNPFAHVLTAAKVDPPTPLEAETRRAVLRIDWSRQRAPWEVLAQRLHGSAQASLAEGSERREPGGFAIPLPGPVPAAGSGYAPLRGEPGEPIPLEVVLAFHPATLAQLLFVRSQLDLADRTDRFLAAALTGILHGKSRTYLSELMPNTFSMAPRYVRDFVRRTGHASPERDVFDCLGAKLRRLNVDGRPPIRGIALLGDARDAGPRLRAALRARALPDRARLVVTSPPYLRVVKYGYYNWLRAWLLGFPAAEIDRTLDDAHHREPYLVFLREVLAGLRPALADDAVVALVIGDVEADRGKSVRGGGIGLAEAAWESAAAPEGYALAGITLDPVAAPRKMTKLWGDEAGQATKLDRILVLGASDAGRRRALAGAGTPVPWE